MITLPGMLMVGARSKADGKTTFTCDLIERFSAQANVVGVKISTIDSLNAGHHPNVTGSGSHDASIGSYCITEEQDTGAHTDTDRMAKAGATKVIWLQVLDSRLEEGIGELVSLLGDETVSICESNRARKAIEPGAFVMIRAAQPMPWKPSAQEVVRHADRIIVSDGNRFNIDPDDIQLIDGRWAIKAQATAIILAGGNSTRMGRDKTMLPICDRPMIKHIYRQLSPYFKEIIISANNSTRHSLLGVNVVEDKTTGRGPLMGIASALRASIHDVNFAIACDIPEIDTRLVRAMLRWVGDYDAVVPTVGPMRYEPLFAVYRKSALPVIEQTLESGNNRVVDALNRCRVKHIDLSGKQLTNINTMGDYHRFIKEKINAGT